MCTHLMARNKKQAPFLMEEMLRRCVLGGYKVGSFQTQADVPSAYVSVNDFHKFLNPKKLLDVRFTYKDDEEEVADFVKKHETYPKRKIFIEGNLRPMEKKDLADVHKLFNMQQHYCVIKYKMSQDELMHHLLGNDNVVRTYVVEGADPKDPLKPVLTDFFSVTMMTTKTVSKEAQMHDQLRQGRLYYYACNKNTIKDIIAQAFWTAKDDLKLDLLSIPMMGTTNPMVLSQLGVVCGDRLTFHHFFNWTVGELGFGQIGQMTVNIHSNFL